MTKSSRGKKSPFYIIFGIIVFIVAAAIFFKPVMRMFFPVNHIDLIKKYSVEYNLDEFLIMAIIRTESKFKEDAQSQKGAKGLMQLKEDTALWCANRFGISYDGDITDPETNIKIGCAYLRYLTDKFQNTKTALAAYNAGEGNVTGWLDSQGDSSSLETIPFEETENYVDLVMKREKIYRFLY